MPRNDRKKIEPRYPKLLELTEAVRQEYCHGGINRDEQFLPQDSQEQFVTLDNVSPALSEACKDDSGNVNQRDFNDLTEIVRKRDCKRLFLTLVMMTWREKEMLSCLIDMVQAEIRDDSLPLEFASDETGRKYAYSLENAESSQRWYIPFEGWEDNDFTTFRFYQWHFLAPVFGADKKFRHQLDRKVPLPFLAVARNPASSGFFGEVSRAEIHPAHIDPKRIPALRAEPPVESRGVVVAIKKAKDHEDLAGYFDKETDNLKNLQEIISPHLIQPIAAYQRDNLRCLIFPWANGGTLENYWENYETSRRDPTSLRWSIEQFTGLCSGLDVLHEYNCRHGDLKPDNILWFKVDRDKGTFQIADLGLAAFHVKDTKRRKLEGMVTMTPSGTSRYEPPETDGNRGTDVSRSRQYDIWSMGCIMLELLVWMMYGFEAVRAFRNRTDHFWLWRWEERTKREYDVHPYVSSCMDIMERQLQGDTCYKALLGLVRDRLLVIAVSEDYQSSPEFREIATELHTSMQVINRRCGLEESYLPPMDLKYPASEIEDNQRSNPPVSESHGMLAVPGQPRRPAYIAKTSQDIPTVPTTEGDDVPRVVVRRPTSELSLSTLSIQEPTILDKQEVGRDNASGKVTLC